MQVLATALDARTKIQGGIEGNETPDVWKLVQEEAVKIALGKSEEENSHGAPSQKQSEVVAAATPSTTGVGEGGS